MALASVFSCARPKPAEPAPEFKTQSVLLDTIPQAVPVEELQFSPDGLEVAYRWKTPDGRQGFAVNGRMERYYDEVGEFLHYTRDGNHYAYRARKEGKDRVVFDGTEEKPYDKVTEPALAATGRSFAYAAKEGEPAFVVFHGPEGLKEGRKDYDLVGPPLVSADGKRVAYPAKQAGRWHYVVDGSEGRPYDEVGYGYFSHNGRTFAHEARRGFKWVIVIDGQESPEYDEVGLFPETAEARVFTAKVGERQFAVVDGKKGPEYEDIGWPSVDPSGKHVAYNAQEGGRAFVVRDGKAGKAYGSVGRPFFSPDGNHLAYDALDATGFLMVDDDRELRDFIALPNPEFSPTGGRLAYGALEPDSSRQFVVVEGKRGKGYDWTGLIVWSPDGGRVAHRAREGAKEFVVLGGKEGGRFDKIFDLSPRFSPDGKYVGFNALKGREVWWVAEAL